MNIINNEKQLLDVINKNKDKKILIVGAGNYGILLGEYLFSKSIEFEGFLDSNGAIKEVLGKNVYRFSKNYVENRLFFISSNNFRIELERSLQEIGVKSEKIYLFSNKDFMIQGINERVKEFKNIHNGQRCFIIGNGPSLKIDDLNKLKNEYTFGCNGIYKIFSLTEWRPTYYCASDMRMFDYLSNIESAREMLNQAKGGIFFADSSGSKKSNELPAGSIYCKTADSKDIETGEPLFSSDCSKVIYTSGSVTYFMLQLAVYMGFDEIILLGMDCSASQEILRDGTVIKKNIINHMPEIEMNSKEELDIHNKMYRNQPYIFMIDDVFAFYKVTKKYADFNGIKIYNATRGGKLEIFERINLDEVILH